MRKIFLLCMLALPSAVMPQCRFADGMEWTTLISGTHEPVYATTIETVSIDGDTVVDGMECLKMYISYDGAEKVLQSVVRADGDKVYFRAEDSAQEWSLCYDFSLGQGEGCYVSSM